MKFACCLATLAALLNAPQLRAESWDNFRAVLRDALEHPALETAPGRYTGSLHIFFRGGSFGDRMHLPGVLEHVFDPFPIQPYTLRIPARFEDVDSVSVRLQTTASNQTMQLTATARSFGNTFDD
jgi:hypothetical protein